MTENTTQIIIEVTPELKDQLRQAAKKEGHTSMSALIRQVLREWLKNNFFEKVERG